MTTYPARLTFDFTGHEAKLACHLQAALDLELPFETDGPQLVVVVDSPQTAYRFGWRMMDLAFAAQKKHARPRS